MLIREATEFDLPSLLKLAKEFHYAANLKRLATFEDSQTGWARWFDLCREHEDGLCLIAMEEYPIGFCTLATAPVFWNSRLKQAQETALWVSDEHRKKGVASALLEAGAEWAKEQGADFMSAGSTVYLNPKAMGGFLRKNGFELEERNFSRRLK